MRATRGSSVDVGLFHDDQRRSVATVEAWVNAGEKVGGVGGWVGGMGGGVTVCVPRLEIIWSK